MGLWQLKSCWPCPHWLWAAMVYPPGLGIRDACPLEMSFPMPREPHTERWLMRAPFAPPRTASGAWLLYWGLFQEHGPGDGVALSTEPLLASKFGGGISSRPLLPGVPCWFAGAGLKPTLEHWALQAGLDGQYIPCSGISAEHSPHIQPLLAGQAAAAFCLFTVRFQLRLLSRGLCISLPLPSCLRRFCCHKNHHISEGWEGKQEAWEQIVALRTSAT